MNVRQPLEDPNCDFLLKFNETFWMYYLKMSLKNIVVASCEKSVEVCLIRNRPGHLESRGDPTQLWYPEAEPRVPELCRIYEGLAEGQRRSRRPEAS